MSKYIVDGSDLTSVADAIRSKGETTASLEFPSGFVDAIGDISGGGSNSKFVELIDRSITTVTAEDLDGATEIGQYAFRYCNDLESVVIPNSVSTVGSYAFYYCASLESVAIGNGVTSIGEFAFSGCTSLNAVYISDVAAWCGILFASSSANPLSNAKNLYLDGELVTDLEIPDSVTSIGSYAFSDCTSLTSATIGNSVTSIGFRAFYYCTSLTSVTFGDSVTSIGDYAIYNCSLLTSIEIPDSVTSIGNDAFYNCYSLKSVTIGNSVTSIGDYAFYNCNLLTNLTCYAVNPPSITSTTLSGIPNNCYIYVPAESLNAYRSAQYWQSYSGRIKAIPRPTELKFHFTSTTSQNLYLTQSASKAVSIDWGDGTITNPTTTSVNASHSYSKAGDYIVKIECAEGSTWNPGATISSTEYALLGANSGKSLSYPTLTEVKFGDGANLSRAKGMAYCTGLTKVTIPQSVSSVASDAFTGCTVVDTIITGRGFNVASSFNNSKTTLKTITISDNNLSAFNFPSKSFDGCTALTGVYISNLRLWLTIYFGNDSSNPLRYANNLYLNNTLVTSIDVPQTITSINSYAFFNYTKLTNITLHQSITSLGHYAFYGCTGLTNVVIPDSITSIGAQTFSSCTNLASVTLSSAITTIPSGAFGECTSLTTFISKAVNPPSISDITSFNNVPNDCAIYVPAESVEAYKTATGWSTRAAYIQAIPTT